MVPSGYPAKFRSKRRSGRRDYGVAVTQAEQHFVVVLASELPRQSVKIVALLGYEFLGVDLPDECTEAVAHLRQIHLHPKPQARIPMIALIP